MNYKIFTEGKDDQAFLIDFLRYLFKTDDLDSINITFATTGGYTNLEKNTPLFQETTDAGGKNIVIFDTDFLHTNGGFDVRYNWLIEQKKKLNLEFELFLFPNNQDEGQFEHLLESIIKDLHKDVINCFIGFETCIKGLNANNPELNYNAPIQKSKIFAYFDTVADRKEMENLKKTHNMCYHNQEYWNFESDNIIPLKTFLLEQIDINNEKG